MLVLVPLAVIVIAFAVANRHMVTVSFDPFSADEPAAAVTLPLFALIILLLIFGVLIGGLAAWLRQGKWRQSARWLEREMRELRQKVDALEGKPAASNIPDEGNPPQRLKLRPPLG
ncbi:MAG: lipopolysaccharide assembly protein LapA domain-containing protein [Xanthobacteraceae bacterium]